MTHGFPMIPSTSLLAGCRRAALPFGLAAALFAPASAAQAQRLLTLAPGVAEASSSDGPGLSIGPVPTAVQVDMELLRGAPPWLEVPTPDGGVLSAERSVFEDRGGGDLMWSGGQPDAGYDTVVLTVEDGRLVGRFGAAGGGAYRIYAAPDGRGGMVPVGGPRPEGVPFCGVDTIPEDAHDGAARVRAGAHAADLPKPVSDARSHDRLDILVGYTATAAENWAGIGGPEVAIRHAGDYLKMVFRNNDLPVEPQIVHVARASAALDRAGRERRVPRRALINLLRNDGDLRRLRHEHRADLVHLFTGENPHLLEACGRHVLLARGDTARSFSPLAYGWTSNHPTCVDHAAVFAHEIGHGLGAHHDPANVSLPPENLFRPYAYGHANFDVMPSLGTAMSYRGQVEPFFSTPRFQPWGAVLGIEGGRDNERLLHATVHIAALYGDFLQSVEGLPAPPSDLRVRYDGGVFRLSWRDNAPDADGYELRWTGSSGYVRLDGRTEASIPLPDHLKQPGTHLAFEVRAWKGAAASLDSSLVLLAVPGEPVAAPSDVAVTVTHQVGIRQSRLDRQLGERDRVRGATASGWRPDPAPAGSGRQHERRTLDLGIHRGRAAPAWRRVRGAGVRLQRVGVLREQRRGDLPVGGASAHSAAGRRFRSFGHRTDHGARHVVVRPGACIPLLRLRRPSRLERSARHRSRPDSEPGLRGPAPAAAATRSAWRPQREA